MIACLSAIALRPSRRPASFAPVRRSSALWRRVALALGFAAVLPLLAATDALPPHPRLLLDAAGVRELQERIATAPWAKASWQELLADAQRAMAQPLELPPRGGNWSHNYVCPTHGARLSQSRKIGPWQWEHVCPVGRHVLLGNPAKATLDFDGNAISSAHARLAQAVVNHGLVFQVTGDARHAARAREILLAYAERYRAYPLHDNQGRPGSGGRVESQSLSEAGWLTTFTQGADLVWSKLSAAERAAIEEQVLRAALTDCVLPRRLGIHNIQCHHNSAIGSVGFLLGDETLIATAIEDPKNGYRVQMEKGVLADGMWTEGASGYHFYTISGLWPLTEAARHCGRNLYGPELKRMFDGPLALAMPDFVLPNFNDSGLVPMRGQADLYELAYARYTNAAYVPLLAASNRRGRRALLAGVPELPQAARQVAAGSRNSPASGYGILEAGAGTNATWLCVKYGPHGGGHGHPDKNTFILYARGEIIAPDAGTHAYGSPLHAAWDKTTLAHNTLVAGETSQQSATGRCLAFGQAQGVDYVIADAGPVYPGVRFLRTAALLNSNLVVFVDQVQAREAQTLDLAYHQAGEWQNLPAGEAWPSPTRAGYGHLLDTTARAVSPEGLTLRTKLAPSWEVAISLAGDEATEAITGTGLLRTTEDRVPMLLQRRRAARTAFVWAIALDGQTVRLRPVAVRNGAGEELAKAEVVMVQMQTRDGAWTLLVNPERLAVEAPLPAGETWRSADAFAVHSPAGR